MRALDLTPDELRAIGRDNALRLLPRLCCSSHSTTAAPGR
jgi:hypothetical protein